MLHLLPAVLFDCVEEDWSLSSRDRTRQDLVLMVQCQSIFVRLLVWLLSSQQVLSGWGFAFPFDLAATTPVLVCRICSFCGSAGISNFCVILNRIDHIFDRSIRNSDPGMRIVLIYGFYSNFNSIFEVLKTGRDFQYRPNSHVSLNPSLLVVNAGSSRGRVYSRQATERDCLKLPVSLVTKYCPTSTTRINPASLQNLLALFSGENDSTCWMYWCQIIWSYNGIFVVQRSFCFDTAPFYLDGLQIPRIWLPLLRRHWPDGQKEQYDKLYQLYLDQQWSVWTLSLFLYFSTSLWTMESLNGKWDVHFLRIMVTSLPQHGPKHIVGCFRKDTTFSQNLVQ